MCMLRAGENRSRRMKVCQNHRHIYTYARTYTWTRTCGARVPRAPYYVVVKIKKEKTLVSSSKHSLPLSTFRARARAISPRHGDVVFFAVRGPYLAPESPRFKISRRVARASHIIVIIIICNASRPTLVRLYG